MPTPRFRPVVICSRSRDFGRTWLPVWRLDHGLAPDQVAWALAQHRAAFEVRAAIGRNALDRTEPGSIDVLASLVGEASSWLRRKLTGQVPADLGDLLGWARILGPQVWPLVEGPADLQLPASQEE